MSRSELYSVRMRASEGARHLSGAERIVPLPRISETVQQFIDRAWARSLAPEQVVLTVEALSADDIVERQALDLTDCRASGVTTCREIASGVLRSNGVSDRAIDEAFRALDRGPSSRGGAMRGAMIMDAVTGERLEPDQARGIRASRFDWSEEAFRLIDDELNRMELTHFRTREALALATKVAYAPGILAELCWSDDAEYTAGYVASRSEGYVRLPQLKNTGSAGGGRSFFIDRKTFELDSFTNYLKLRPVIITALGRCRTVNDIDVLRRGH